MLTARIGAECAFAADRGGVGIQLNPDKTQKILS